MLRILTLMVVIVLAVTPAFAQPMSGKFELAASGGVNMPTGDIGDGTNTGYVFAGSAGIRVMPMLVLGAEFGYYSNGASDDVLAALGAGADMTTSFTQYAVMGKFMFPMLTDHNMYAKGLVGAYTATVSFENLPLIGSGETSDTNFGFGIGGGLRLNGSSKYSFFAEGMFHNIMGETQDAQMFSATAGILVALP